MLKSIIQFTNIFYVNLKFMRLINFSRCVQIDFQMCAENIQ